MSKHNSKMRAFFTGVVNHSRLILVVFAALTVLCAFLQQEVSVNYDMNDYLPEDSPSTLALDVMDEAFSGGIPNVRVMLPDVTLAQALDCKAQLEAVEGVTEVLWLDDSASLSVPLEFLDQDTVETYYKDGNAIFTVTVDEEHLISATDAIREIIGDEGAMSGSGVSTAVATVSTVDEIRVIVVVAILFALFVLALTTRSWLDPIVILGTLGVAVVINAGSNLIFGEISFVTNAAGGILQLAVSLDYCVFLLHRYEECLLEQPDPKTAMVDALCRSISSILSSGLTTVIGFFALIFMRFGIGADLGIALAKGVGISLLTVFLFFPALLLAVWRWIEATRHRSLLPSFRGFGRVVTRVMFPAALAVALAAIPSYWASNQNSYYYGSSHIFGSDTQLGQDIEAIEAVFGQRDTYVVLVPDDGDLETQKALSDQLEELPEVKSVLSYAGIAGSVIPSDILPESIGSQLISNGWSRMVLTVEADYEGEETFALVEEIREIAASYYPDEYYLAGEGVSTYDLMDTITADTVKVNLIAIGAVFLVLLLTMKSVTLPVILVLSIETAIWINLTVPVLAGSTIFYISYLIISSIQLGATVDYAILFTERYREARLLRPDQSRRQAVEETVSATTVSILTSGSVLTVVGFLLGGFSSHGVLSQLGTLLGRGTLLSMAVVLFALPGLLYVFDRLVVPKHKE